METRQIEYSSKFIFLRHFDPLIPYFHNDLADFPNGPPPAPVSGYVVSRLFRFRHCVPNGNSETDPPEKGDIDDVISDIGDLRRVEIHPDKKLFKNSGFVPDRLVNFGDSEVTGTV